MSSQQPFAGECLAGMGFKVALEGKGFVFIREGNGSLDAPWIELAGVRRETGIVFAQTCVQVFGVTDVGLCGEGDGPEYVDVVVAGIFWVHSGMLESF